MSYVTYSDMFTYTLVLLGVIQICYILFRKKK